VRTEELLQADRYYCSSQYFTVAADYGFSKGLDEALQKWGKDDGRVFYEVVRVVRMTRPLVITSVFVGGPSDGHGNHAAAGLWAQKVFLAAGDPNVFPDQIKDGLRPWNPLKEYARVPFSWRKDMFPRRVSTIMQTTVGTGRRAELYFWQVRAGSSKCDRGGASRDL